LAAKVATEIAGEEVRARVAPVRLLRHRSQTDRLEVAGDVIAQCAGRAGLLMDDLIEHPAPRSVEGAFAGEELVEDDAERVDVGARIDRLDIAARLLGRHVRGRSEDLPVDDDGDLAFVAAREAEVGDVGSSGWIEKD